MCATLPNDVWEWIVGYEGAPLAWLEWMRVSKDGAAARKLQRAARIMIARSHVDFVPGNQVRVQYRGKHRPWNRGTLVRLDDTQWVVHMMAPSPRKWYVFVPNPRVRFRQK